MPVLTPHELGKRSAELRFGPLLPLDPLRNWLQDKNRMEVARQVGVHSSRIYQLSDFNSPQTYVSEELVDRIVKAMGGSGPWDIYDY